jgi:hypothetical protein
MEMTMTNTKTLIALSAIALGVLSATSAAFANENQDNGEGGYVLPGNMDGVNPVYHPRWFPQHGRVTRAYDRENKAIYSGAGSFAVAPLATGAYAFAPFATHHKHR